MEKLIRGVHSFQEGVFSSQQELFERLAGGQRPDALFITCSDSRINPNLLTQTHPGDLFILRNAGNIVPPYQSGGGEAATIEFAVAALGIRDVIVCGHSHCGAVQGLLEPSRLERLPAVRSWLRYAEATARIMQEKYGDEAGEDLLTDAVKENVLVQLDHLRTHPAVAAGVATGRVKLHGWVYQFETGEVFAFDPAEQRFRALSRSHAAPGGKTPDVAI